MTEDRNQTDDMLDGFLDAARQEAPLPDPAFMARMEALALETQPVFGATSTSTSRWDQLRSALGGWPGIAGLALASAAGLLIGVSPPEGLLSLYDLQSAGLGLWELDPFSGFDITMLEG